MNKRPDLSNGGLHLSYSGDGLFRFEYPHIRSACKSVSSGVADGCLSDPNEIIVELNVRGGRASDQRLKRVSADLVDGVAKQRLLGDPLTQPRMCPLREHPLFPRFMRSRKTICRFWAI